MTRRCTAAVDDGRAAFAAAADLDDLAACQGRPPRRPVAPLALANREIGALPPHAKGDAGRRVNEALRALTAAYEAAPGRRSRSERDARVLRRGVGRRHPAGDRRRRGARHPLTTVQERIADIFVAMGYEVAEGPEVEHEWFNFDALNIGPDHPARDARRTRLFVDPPRARAWCCARTPRPVQIRTPARPATLPVYVVCPGRTYRTDPLDATHTPVFHQVEGLAVDEGITMAHLQGHARRVRRGDVRRRAAHPAAAVLLPVHRAVAPRWTCSASSAAAPPRCPAASPAGPAAPRAGSSGAAAAWSTPRCCVACGVDPERYTGFAFGMGSSAP